jgi:hypothetical protein
MFAVGEIYECNFAAGVRSAVVELISDDGRRGTLRFIDTSETFETLWIDLHQKGEWHKVEAPLPLRHDIRSLEPNRLSPAVYPPQEEDVAAHIAAQQRGQSAAVQSEPSIAPKDPPLAGSQPGLSADATVVRAQTLLLNAPARA